MSGGAAQAVQGAALLCTIAALLSGGLALAVTRDARASLAVLLDLLTAAGLLRLALPPTPSRLLSAAAVVAVRRLLVVGLAAPSRRSGPGR